MSAEEIEIETVPGLPGDLPDGETLLWQGRPEWRSLARYSFKVRLLAGYFAVFIALRLLVVLQQHQGLAGLGKTMLMAGAALGSIGVLAFMARAYARTTIYTITSKRIVLRIGIALPMTWNLPFKRIASADLLVRKDGRGDISLRLSEPNRIAWLHLWPHAQPWHMKTARPMLRAIAEPDYVAGVLADAVRAWAQAEDASVKVVPRAPGEPMLEIGIMAPARVQHELATEAGR